MSVRLNILYLVNRRYFLYKLARERFLSILEIGKIADVTTWGIGWDGYDNSKTVADNIKSSGDTYDLIIAYKPLEYRKIREVNIPLCLRYNEMWDTRWTLREIGESGCNLVICHHLNDYRRYTVMKIDRVKFVYVGHCIDPTIFRNYGGDKKYDIMLGGHVSARHYPLRARLRNIISGMSSKYRVYIHPHPGYDLADAHTNKYLIEFARRISESRIAVTCASKYGYRLGKYVEIPACNTVIAADLPDDNADDYSYIIRLNNRMSDAEIRNKLITYLENRDKYEEKLFLGEQFVRHYTWDKYARRVISEINIFLNDR